MTLSVHDPARGDWARSMPRNRVDFRRACSIAKAMPFVADLTPLQVGGEDAQATDDPAEAVAQLKELGRRKWPTASAADQFERAMTDPANHVIARKAVPIPRATTSFPFSR